MKAIIIISSILLLGTLCAEAQESPKKQKMGGGAFTIGYGNMDVSKLHEFVPASVGEFSNQHLLLGGEGHAFIGKLILGGSGHAMIGDVIKTDSTKYGLAGGMGTFDIGYLALNKSNLKIFPMIGVGFGGYGINISHNNSISKNEVINDPYHEINISTGGFVFDASVTINLIPALNYDEKKESYGGFMTGLKMGYIYSLPSSDWKFSDEDVTGGPDFGLNMFYVKLMIGGFGQSNNSSK